MRRTTYDEHGERSDCLSMEWYGGQPRPDPDNTHDLTSTSYGDTYIKTESGEWHKTSDHVVIDGTHGRYRLFTIELSDWLNSLHN